MCTVTVVAQPSGFRVMCNRDERVTRSAALAPQWRRIGRRRAAFPVDPDGAGTWIGINDAGLALVLLNRTAGTARTQRPHTVSRGLIIPTLLPHGDLEGALMAALRLDVGTFRPFRLIALRGGNAGVLTSDGSTLRLERCAITQPMLFTSSSLGDSLVRGPRRRLFERLVLASGKRPLCVQPLFHDHQWRCHPELSVRMARLDARTVSRSTIDVSAAGITLRYEPLGT